MAESDQEHQVQFFFTVAQKPDSTMCVTMNITVCGVANTSIALDPDMAIGMATHLAKELTRAGNAAKAEQRKQTGIVVAAALPDTLRGK